MPSTAFDCPDDLRRLVADLDGVERGVVGRVLQQKLKMCHKCAITNIQRNHGTFLSSSRRRAIFFSGAYSFTLQYFILVDSSIIHPG